MCGEILQLVDKKKKTINTSRQKNRKNKNSIHNNLLFFWQKKVQEGNEVEFVKIWGK